MPDQAPQLEPRKNLFDPDFAGWLQQKGLIDVVKQVPILAGTIDVPVDVKQGMKDDFAHFIKGKGYGLLDEPLPSKEEAAANLEASTQKLRDLYIRESGATIGPIEKEKVESTSMVSPSGLAAMQGPRAETIGPPRPRSEREVSYSEIQAQRLPAEASFWRQMADVASLIKKGETGAAAGFFVDAAVHGLSFGIINPQMLDKVDKFFKDSGISGETYKSLKDRRDTTLKTLGYYPAKAAGAVSFVYSILPISKVARFAKGVGAAASTVPAVQRLITAAVGGLATGTAQVVGEKLAGEKFDLEKDIKKIPTHMLWWSLFEFGTLGAQAAAKIVNWNLRYGPEAGTFWERMKTGKFGGYGAAQGINIETQYAPGRGPTVRRDFTAAEIQDIFRRADPSYSGANKIPLDAEGGSWERSVYNSIRDQSGWREAVRRGWMSPQGVQVPGEPPVITGFRTTRGQAAPPSVNGEPIPMKPDVGQVFRKGGAPRAWPVPENAPEAAGGPTAVPPPPSTGAPGIGPTAAQREGIPGQTPPPAGPPPAGSAPPAVAGSPRAQKPPPAPPQPGPIVPRPPITTPPPEPPPGPPRKIKVTGNPDGSFTVENVSEPVSPKEPIVTPPAGEIVRPEPKIVGARADLLPKGWSLRVGKTRTKEGHTAEGEVDWRGKTIVFSDQKYMNDPEIANHEIAHVMVEMGISENQQKSLLNEYIELKKNEPQWKKYGKDWIVENNFHSEEIAMDLGEYLNQPRGVENKLGILFDKYFPSAKGIAEKSILPKEILVTPPPRGTITPEPKAEARTDQALRDAIDRIQSDEGAPADVRLVAQAARRSERLKKVVEGLKARQRTDLLTGVGSDRALAKNVGWEQRPVVLFDLAGVRAANNDPKRGYKWSDNNIFKPAGRIFRAFGDDRVYRRGGTADEFPLVGKPGQTVEDLKKDAELISDQLNRSGVEHRFAVGNNFSEAEKGMAVAKESSRVMKATSATVPDTLDDLEKHIVRGRGVEYLTMTGQPQDAVATMSRSADQPIRIKRTIDDTFVKNPKTGMTDFPNRAAAWQAYLGERQNRGLRLSSPAFPSKRFIKAMETPQERARRLFMSKAKATEKRGNVGWPKGANKLWDDIFELTGGAGIKPDVNANTGRVSVEFEENVPKFMRNQGSRYSIDEIQNDLTAQKGYNFDKDDLYSQLREAEKQGATGRGEAEGRGFEPYAEAIQTQLDDMKKQFAPLMETGETLDEFLVRMRREAAEDGFGSEPEDVDEYIADRLTRTAEEGTAKEAKGGATDIFKSTGKPVTEFRVNPIRARGRRRRLLRVDFTPNLPGNRGRIELARTRGAEKGGVRGVQPGDELLKPPTAEEQELPKQEKIPERGTYTAIRTDDGGIYFSSTISNHYELIERLKIPAKRVVGGGFIHGGVYDESPLSEGARIGRDAREAAGLPRETPQAPPRFPKSEIAPEVERLTSGKNFPREWSGNTIEEVKDNRQNLTRFVLENYDPKSGPLENYINANKKWFIRGEAGRAGLAKVKAERQFPVTPEGTEVEFPAERSALAPESQPKNKPPAEPEMPGKTSKEDLFGAEEIRVINALRSAAQAHNLEITGNPAMEDKLVDILKSRLMADWPESFESIANRLGMSREFAREHFYKMLEGMKDSPVIKEIQRAHMKQANLGPAPSEEDLRRLAKWIRKYFSSYRGADKIIDMQNDQRIGEKMSDIFNATLDAGVIKKWLDSEIPAANEYARGLLTGALTGDAYTDIFNAEIPFKVKEAMLTTRARIDRLSELIMTHGGLAEETKATFENNLGKYLTKSYRLWEDKRWSPTDAQKEGFKRFLMNQYHMTPEQADASIEADLAYGRNDEGARPRRSRRTRRIPTDHYIRRKELSPEWRAFAGEIDRLPWLVLNTITEQATTAYNAKFLNWIKEYLPDHWTDNYEEAAQRGWQHSQLEAHSYGYGELAGKWVDPELHRYIKQEFETNRSDVEEAIQRFIMNPFKWTKTIGSIPAQIRNPLSNIGLSILGRNTLVNPLNLKWYLKSLDAHMHRTGSARELWTDMIAKGVTGTQYYGEEIPKIQKSIARFEEETWLDNLWDDIIKWPINKLGEAYNLGDSLFRVATYLHDTEGRGMDPTKAVDELNAGLQNYRKLPVVVDVLRRWPLLGPFISFKANVLTIVGRQSKMGADEMKNPATRGRGLSRILRLALFLSIPTILSEVSRRVNDVDDDQIKRLEKYYPDYRRGGTFVYFRGDEGQLKVFDLSFVWPTGDLQRMFKSMLNGDISGLKDATDFFSHPLFDLWNIVIKGQDPQWGTKYRTVWEQAKAAVAYLYVPASMPIPDLGGIIHGDVRPGALTGPQIKTIIDAFNQQPDRYGRVKKLPEEIKNFFTGIRTWDVAPDKLLMQATVSRNSEINDLRSEYTGWIIRNSKAPQREKDNKAAEFKSRVEQLGNELREIGQLREELSKNGFKVTRY